MSLRSNHIWLSCSQRSGHVRNRPDCVHQFISHDPDVCSPSQDFGHGINAMAIVGVTVDQVRTLLNGIFPADHEMRKYSSVKEFKVEAPFYASGFLGWVTGTPPGSSGVLWSLPKDHFFPVVFSTSLWSLPKNPVVKKTRRSPEEAPEARRYNQFFQGLNNLRKGHTVFAKVIYLSFEVRRKLAEAGDAELKIKHYPYPDHVLARARYFDPVEVSDALGRKMEHERISPLIAPFPISAFENDLDKLKAFKIADVPVFNEAAPGIFEFFKAIDQHYIVM